MTPPHTVRENDKRGLSSSFAVAARRLDQADCLDEFISAMDVHRTVWSTLHDAAEGLGVAIPERIMHFSLAAADRLHHGLSDHEIETLIQLDHYVSAILLETPGSGDRL